MKAEESTFFNNGRMIPALFSSLFITTVQSCFPDYFIKQLPIILNIEPFSFRELAALKFRHYFISR